MLTEDRIAHLAGSLPGGTVTRTEALAGDASTRRFYRIRFADGSSVVAMVFEAAIDPDRHPQVLLARHFESLGFPVPSLIEARAGEGVLFFEDLGDRLLQDCVRGVDSDPSAPIVATPEVERLYESAVDLIVDLQSRGGAGLGPGHPSVESPLDAQRFGFELRFFREHYIEGLRGLRFGPRESSAIERFIDALAADAAAEPWTLCHRDFHSRNLLVHEGRIRLIDFQDARMGPAAYDLVSLVKDSYVVLPAPFRESLIDRYVRGSGALAAGRDRFGERLDRVGLQRNLKAIGTFAYQAVVRRKDGYLPFIPATWAYVFEALPRLPEYADAVPILEIARGDGG